MSRRKQSKTWSASAFEDAAHLRDVISSAVDGIVTIDEHGVIEAVNPAAERLFGYTADELIGRNVSLLMPAPYRDAHDGYIAEYLRTGRKRIIGLGREVQGRRRDGSIFPLYVAVSETNLGNRRVFTGTLHDLTALKIAEERATQFGRILEESLNEIYVFRMDTLLFLHVNRGAVRNTGYSVDDLTRMTLADLSTEFTEAQVHELIEPLVSGTQETLEFETTHRRRDGTIYHVLLRLHRTEWSGQPALAAFVLDISERVQRDLELSITRRAIQAANEGIVIFSATEPGHPILLTNPAFETLTGYTAGEAAGRSCDLLSGPGEAPEGIAELQQAISEHREYRATISCTRRNGDTFWNEISLAPVRSPDGTVTHVVAVMEDVSRRRAAQEQLLQAERLAAIGQMVTGLAHESRNALQRAQACLDMLALDLSGNPELLELTEKTRRALQDLHRYYEEVRNYAAPIRLRRRPTDLRTLWRRVWRDLEPERYGRDLQLTEQGSESTVCQVDEYRMEQVFRNILENAVAACSAQGCIHISWKLRHQPDCPHLEVLIRDSGEGIRPDALQKLFEPFFTTKQKGTGLGLAIVRRIIDAHGGTISAATPPDGGAEIRIVLPQRPAG